MFKIFVFIEIGNYQTCDQKFKNQAPSNENDMYLSYCCHVLFSIF